MSNERMYRTMRWPLVALLLTGLTLPALAQQTVDRPVVRKKAAANDQYGWFGTQRLTRALDEYDRAAAIMDLSRLQIETYNYGPLTGDNFGSSFTFPNKAGTSRNYIFASNFAVAVDAGLWHPNPIVHESYTHDWAKYDWDTVDGSKGALFADPPQYIYGFPMFAVSDLPATWPAAGWPAPDVTDVWFGTETWSKWSLVGDRNAYAEFDDTYADREADGQSRPLDLSVRMRAIAYSALNVVYFQYELTNNSSNTYTGVYLGLMADTGGPTTSDFEGSLVYDESQQLIYSISSTYDAASGTQTRPGSSEVAGFVAHQFLESPTGSLKRDGTGAYVDNPTDVVTRVALLSWNDYIDPSVDGEDQLYGAMSGEVSYMDVGNAQLVWKADATGANPVLKQDHDDFLAEYGDQEDPFFYVSSGPFTLSPGESVDFVVAGVAGYDEAGLRVEAEKSILTFNAKFNAPAPPLAPAGFQANGILAGPHGKNYDPVLHDYRIFYTPSGDITLSWDYSLSLATPDPNSAQYDFEGVKIFRSEDRGATWGERRLDSQQNPVGWYPIVQFDLDNGFEGDDPMTGRYLGSNTGLVSTWTDPNAADGFEYWYAITAYDHGAFISGVQTGESLETAIPNDPNYPTVIAVIAGSPPSGYVSGAIGTGTAAGSEFEIYTPDHPTYEAAIVARVFNDAVITGNTYSITLTDYYIDARGDTVKSNILTPLRGDEYFSTGVTLTNTTTAQALFRSLQPSLEAYNFENLPVTEGFRLFAQDVNDGNPGVYDFSVVEVPDSTGWSLYTDLGPYRSGSLERLIYNQAYWDFDVIWRTNDPAGDPNQVITVYDRVVVDAPFEVYNSETGVRYWAIITDDFGSSNDWDHGWEGIYITNVPYADDFFDPVKYPYHDAANPSGYWTPYVDNTPSVSRRDWLYYFDFNESNPNTWYEGETWHASIYKPLATLMGSDFDFATTASSIDQAEISLDDIKVVPNPYYVYARWDQNVNRRKIQFINVPPNTTIDIYTLSGDLIASLDHGDTYNGDKIGVVNWNIWTYEYTEAAYGLYLFVARTTKADGSTVKKVGKFAIIR